MQALMSGYLCAIYLVTAIILGISFENGADEKILLCRFWRLRLWLLC
jgi:hypothetical protein